MARFPGDSAAGKLELLPVVWMHEEIQWMETVADGGAASTSL
jgi:hypothetical protein